MSELKVTPIRKFNAEITVPGDKSISHRAAIFGSMASGRTRITGYLNSADCLCTMNIMKALGTQVDQVDPTTFIIDGRNGKFLKPAESLDCGNSGTSMRLISGLLSAQPFATRLYGDASLSRRPMRRIAEPLRLMGGHLTCEGLDYRPPLNIQGSPLTGISYHTPVPSAQIKSCILIAGLQAEGKTSVKEDLPSRDHTERMLRHFHASIVREGTEATVYGKHELHGQDVNVPGDISSAAFWLVAAAAFPGAKLTIRNLGLNPTRTGILNILVRMGASITEQVENTAEGTEPIGTVIVNEGCILKATEIGGVEIPNVIDEIPILAVAAALAEGTTEISDAKELRVKETDRIATIATNLRAFGVPVEEKEDGLLIEGGAKLKGAHVKSYGDHRIAMAFAILGLFSEGTTLIEDTDCISTSYPGFEDQIARIIDSQKLKLNPLS